MVDLARQIRFVGQSVKFCSERKLLQFMLLLLARICMIYISKVTYKFKVGTYCTEKARTSIY